MDAWLAPIVSYGFAVIVGHFAIRPVVDRLWRALGWMEGTAQNIRPEHYLPRLVGFVERALFVASLQLGKAEFIGVWIALKVAGQWKRWGEGVNIGGRVLEGRSFYNIFLIGSGLSVAYAVVGAQMLESLKKNEWFLALGLPLALLVATYLLALLVAHYEKSSGSTGSRKKGVKSAVGFLSLKKEKRVKRKGCQKRVSSLLLAFYP